MTQAPSWSGSIPSQHFVPVPKGFPLSLHLFNLGRPQGPSLCLFSFFVIHPHGLHCLW